MSNEQISKIGYFFLIVTTIAVATISVFGYNAYKEIGIKKEQIEIQQKIESETRELSLLKITDYERIVAKNSSLNKKDVIINENCSGSVKSNKCKLEKTYNIKGKINKGYLYIECSIDNKALSSWDNVYFTIRNGTIKEKNIPSGGHLLNKMTLEVPENIKTNKSVFLYKIDTVPYYSYDNKDKKRYNGIANFFDLINQSKDSQITIETFIDSTSKNRKFNKISIYYECEEGNSCIED